MKTRKQITIDAKYYSAEQQKYAEQQANYNKIADMLINITAALGLMTSLFQGKISDERQKKYEDLIKQVYTYFYY